MLGCVLMFSCVVPVWGQDPGNADAKDSKAEQLGQRLIRKAVAQQDEDLMETVLRLMDEAAKKLEIEFDAGRETQVLQGRIVDRLEEAIRQAAAQRRSSRRSQSQWTGEKRRGPSQAEGGQSKQSSAQSGSADSKDARAASSSADPPDVEPHRGELREVRRTWGLLPRRQRDEIIQGSGEAFLERYREWIERYYRALQEAEE